MTETLTDAALQAAQNAQLERLAQLEAQGEVVGGWKLGLTSGQSRDRYGPGIRPFGFILASRILSDGATLDWADVVKGGIENELCFVLQQDVTEPVTAASVQSYLAGVAPGFEINQRRPGAQDSAHALIADGLSNWGIVVGDVVALSAAGALDQITVSLAHDGGAPVAQVDAAGHIDDQFETLAKLANQLLPHGRHLRAGDCVITGAFGRQPEPESGRWQGDFGATVGRVSVRVAR